jgi:hypothetical protein
MYMPTTSKAQTQDKLGAVTSVYFQVLLEEPTLAGFVQQHFSKVQSLQ